MKKVSTTILKDGEKKTIFAFVDDETARVLERVEDKAFVDQYIYDEYKLQMKELKHARMTQSLDKSVENGFDAIDESSDLEENLITHLNYEALHKAIEKLEPQQRWLIKKLYFEKCTLTDIAKELGVTKQAISNRNQKILKKLKIFLN